MKKTIYTSLLRINEIQTKDTTEYRHSLKGTLIHRKNKEKTTSGIVLQNVKTYVYTSIYYMF